ncbi:ABC transporter permease [uncultured Paludibaculum sp.]|uniref:ABC transporter permease n=1 Tax=uncultured Paludibaculum sp. TaxID=1765020 RepID=UPI002AAB9EBB|nr:ABC transporter permease [uncultured Paludibaculum sp.]
MNTLLWDLRYAFRGFLRSPGFTLTAMLSLAIGIGANSAIFSVASALLLQPLPYQNPERLAILWNRSPGLNIAEDWFSTAQYFDIRNGHSGFEQLAIAIGANYNLTGSGEPERVGTIRVSSNLLPMLGAKAALGRLFLAAEDHTGRGGTAVLSHSTWVRRFGGDTCVIGRSLTLNGQPYEIVGVLPAAFSLPREVLPTLGVAEDGEIFLPLPLDAAAASTRTREDYNIIGRLRSGVTVQQAQTEMDTITARLRRDYPDFYPPNSGLTFSIVPLLEQVVGDVRRPLVILLGSVAFVLLIACANVANLLLARALGRQKEIAIRVALGASRRQIMRQLLTESLLLSLGGGALGVVLALWSVGWIHAIQPQNVPRLSSIAITGEVLLFTFTLSLLSGLLFGLAPALRLTGADPAGRLKEAGRGAAGANSVWGRGNHLRRLLVISELALSVVLLIGAGLLIRSFARLLNVPPGFQPQGVLTFELTMSARKYAKPENVLNTYRDLWQRLDRLPGVTASGGVSSLPLSNYFSWGPISVEGRTPQPGEAFINADQRIVGGRYFETLRIPLLSGRLFTERDKPTNPRVIVIDEYMAQQLWPNQDPIGKRIRTGGIKSEDPWLTVIGVVRQVKQYGLDATSRIAFYLPQTQYPVRAMYVTLHTAASPVSLVPVVKQEIRELDPDLPVYRVRTMQQRVDESMARRRFSMTLLTLFAALALALAAVGIYGVMSYLVDQGAREIGIRMALGATPHGILGFVIWRGILVALCGIGSGLLGAVALTRVMSSLLYGIEPTDAATFAAIAGLLAGIALLASYVPARRAARIDPMTSLRSE